jgi:hypothetical protein
MPHRIDVVATCLEAIENACRFRAAQSELQSIKAPYVIACLMKEVHALVSYRASPPHCAAGGVGRPGVSGCWA